MRNRAQISTIDFLTAVFIFSLVLAYAVSSLNDASIRTVTETDYKYMIINTLEISDILVKNPGIPSSWNSTYVEFPGLASDDRIISPYKVNQFCNLTENQIRSIFRIPYFIYFSIIGNSTVECGLKQNGTKSVSIRRNVLFENKNAVLEVTLWK